MQYMGKSLDYQGFFCCVICFRSNSNLSYVLVFPRKNQNFKPYLKFNLRKIMQFNWIDLLITKKHPASS